MFIVNLLTNANFFFFVIFLLNMLNSNVKKVKKHNFARILKGKQIIHQTKIMSAEQTSKSGQLNNFNYEQFRQNRILCVCDFVTKYVNFKYEKVEER